MAKPLGKQIGEEAKKQIAQRAGGAIANVGRGSGSGASQRPFQSSSSEHHTSGLISIIVLVLVFFGIFLFWPTISGCFKSGFCEERIVDPIRESQFAEALQDTTRFIGKQAKESSELIQGKRTFNLEGNVDPENSGARSGIWFERGRGYRTESLVEIGEGEDVSALGNEFGAFINIVVGKFDDKIDEIEADVGCSLIGKKETAVGFIRGYGNGKKIIFDNPKEENKRTYEDVVCVFNREQANILKNTKDTKVFFSGDVLFELNYRLNPFVSLPVFVIGNSEEFYDQYYHRPGSAFNDLLDGEYKEHISGIKSTALFDTDVKAFMRIIEQPLFTSEIAGENELPTFGIQFKNENIKNNVTIESFDFSLPEGLRITHTARIASPTTGEYEQGSCEYFESKGKENGREVYNFRETFNGINYFKDIEKQLNGAGGLTGLYLCRLTVDPDLGDDVILSGIGDIEGQLKYKYKVIERVRIRN